MKRCSRPQESEGSTIIKMSLSGHHLLASSQRAASPKSPATAGGFNCLCINAIPLAPCDSSYMPSHEEHLTAAAANSMPERIQNDLLSTSGRRSSLQLSGPDTGTVLDSDNFISQSRSSLSFSSSHLDVLAPVFEKFSAEIGRASLELTNQLDSKIPFRQSTEIPATDGTLTRSVDEKRKPKPRRVFIDDPSRTHDDGDMVGNKVRTSKYTLLTFLPKNLFEQFRRVAYIYFLAIVILNQIPQLAVFGRTASLFPLLFVLVVTAIKDGYEDWGRHKSDIIENNRLAKVLSHGEFIPKKWKRIQVGEVVWIEADAPVPCDMVLLGTSDPNGVAYIQTLNLDGESNLKTRYACQETQIKRPDINPLCGCIVCDQPTRNIYEFSANMEFDGQEIPLGPKNVILRGCKLKNTSWVVGVVVYAGKDTKVMMNSAGARSKRSKLESQMNTATMWLAFFLLIICLVGGVGMGLWVSKHSGMLSSLAYYHKKDASTGEDVAFYHVFGEAVFAFLSFVIMFQVMIPISLYISMELVRLGQSRFMSRDEEMYYDGSETRFECRALNINEDLGQVKYVFSDKTGTLTQNKMVFYAATIDGVNYSEGVTDYDMISYSECEMERGNSKQPVKVSPRLLKLLQTIEQAPNKKALHEFFLVLAICNTVVPIRADEESQVRHSAPYIKERILSIEYQAESPDEQALVSAAASYGYILLERSTRHVLVDVQGELQRYEILGLHDFDSVRKRMSVVVQCPDGSIKLLLKGADTTVLNLVRKCSLLAEDSGLESHIANVYSSTLQHLKVFAELGLRTLLIASKELSEVEFHEWEKRFMDATSFLGNNRVTMLQKVAEIVERNLLLLGATGVEDKLQDGVPETIAALRDAGMKVWVLTGDKQETAVSIGFSCNLLTHEMEMITISTTTERDCATAISNAIEKQRIYSQQNASLTWALIIDGNSLVHALRKDLEQKLFDLATSCQVVICCRVAPSQKANIVSLIKDKTREMTLAIGDGANDVPMLQKAHVGIGLSGQEGRQAVMSSDFSMGQFRFLKKLLLVHGHWNYQRLSHMILYNFYRNSVFVMMLFWYILQTAFSPSSAIFDWNLMFYSLIYTSVPTVVVGIFDKDISQRSLLDYPPLYGAGQRDENYNSLLFWVTMLDTLWQSLVLFYVPLYTFEDSTIDIWSIGSLWTIAVVILVNLHLALDVQWWTWITHLAIWGSIVSTFCCLFILDAIKLESFLPHYWVIFQIVQTFNYWYDIVFIVVLALLPRFLIKIVVQRVWPSDAQIIREVEAKRNI